MEGQITAYRDYRTFLRDVFDGRCQVNPRYSLRAFARDLDIRPSHLSEILRTKKGLSLDNANQLAEKIGLGEIEKEYFCDLVLSQDARSAMQRELANERLQKRFAKEKYEQLQTEVFRVVSDWYHYAIIELCRLDEPIGDTKTLSKRLKISELQANHAVERLIRLGFIKYENGRWVTLVNKVTTRADSSIAIRKHQMQMLDKAEESLNEDPPHTRDFSTVVVGIDPSQLSLAKSKIQQFRRELAEVIKGSHQTQIYSLAIQLFRLDKDSITQGVPSEMQN